MPYIPVDDEFGFQAIETADTVQKHEIGKRIRAKDSANVSGEGEFIYLKGVAATVIGDLVIYDQRANTTTRAVAGSRGPAAVAMSANVANQFGWYQISGAAIVKSLAAVAGSSPYVTATAGTVDDAVVATDKIDGARYKTADGTPSAGFAVLQLDRPSLNANG
jgi:hypothetical protein